MYIWTVSSSLVGTNNTRTKKATKSEFDSTNSQSDILLIDVTVMRLGIELKDGFVEEIMYRNRVISTYTSKKLKMYQLPLINDTDQKGIIIRIIQGERPKAKDNHILGEFILNLENIYYWNDIKIEFKVDWETMLTVKATDVITGNSKKIKVKERESDLSWDEMDKMIRIAQELEEDDNKLNKAIDAKHTLETTVYTVKHALDTNNESIKSLSVEERESIHHTSDNMIKWIGNNAESEENDYLQKQSEFDQFLEPFRKRLNYNFGLIEEYEYDNWYVEYEYQVDYEEL